MLPAGLESYQYLAVSSNGTGKKGLKSSGLSSAFVYFNWLVRIARSQGLASSGQNAFICSKFLLEYLWFLLQCLFDKLDGT